MADLTAAALEAYERTEAAIQAWVEVDPQAPLGDGPLNGIPFGVKDIFETKGLATEYGSHLYTGRKGAFDATIVTQLRELGAVLFGKTQTTAFAYFDPPPTRNPRNLSHTPGGSSSGSAAAVAAGVVPFALGTQTMGSIIRPASFCGVVGFKPSFGALPRDGVLPFAPSLDTVGFLAESVSVCMELWSALGYETSSDAPVRFGVPEGVPAVSAEMQSCFSQTIRAFGAEPVAMPQPYDVLLTAARTVNDYEGARSHHERWLEFGDRIGAKLSDLIRRGMRISESEYRESLRILQTAAEQMRSVFARYPVLLTPAALGSAPAGLASTGDPAMNAVWTAMGCPAISIPMATNGGLPLGLQLIAAHGSDDLLLHAAQRSSDSMR
jgi:Asp-tRNA(Asn)/Glu-tRNA(Gln) amidotransferase A subunit family amidase